VRSVGWMSRRDLVTRGVGAGPDMPTPEAQCIGTDTFDFTLGCLANNQAEVAALGQARALRRAPVKLRGTSTKWRAPLTLTDERIQISAIRRVAVDGGTAIELRLWNPTDEHLATGLDESWQTVRADGTPTQSAASAVLPHCLLTLRRKEA
jgi:mannosylglycerate hydrolase